MTTTTQLPVTSTWELDKAHSQLQFKVKHLMISTVTGAFDDFDVNVEGGSEDFDNSRIVFEARTASINTNNQQRDNHLRSDDFFDAEKFPVIRFESDGFQKTGRYNFALTGRLTIKGVTKAVLFEAEYGGSMVDPYGNRKAGFELNGKIRRSDFGLTWNAATETGGVVVGDEIKIKGDIQLVLKTDESKN